MFTGLIEATGRLSQRTSIEGGQRLVVESPLAQTLHAGDSLAVNGVCLTVVSAKEGAIAADVGPETLRVASLGRLAPGTVVNLEQPLRADARLGGHFVQGHVDATGRLVRRRKQEDFEWMTFTYPLELAHLLVMKGSIAVDGISLTIADLGSDAFDVQVVPFTLDHTNLRSIHIDDPVNLEFDMLGKYVARVLQLAGPAVQEVK